MTKVGKFFRQSIEKKLIDGLQNSESFFLLQYSGLSSVQMTLLRHSLAESKSRILVVKNSLMHRALKSANIEGMQGFVTGPTAVVFTSDDVSVTSKVLMKFAKENGALNLGGAFFQNRILNKKDIEGISNLPSKDILRAQVVMSLKAPLTNLVFTLKGNLNKLVTVLSRIKEK